MKTRFVTVGLVLATFACVAIVYLVVCSGHKTTNTKYDELLSKTEQALSHSPSFAQLTEPEKTSARNLLLMILQGSEMSVQHELGKYLNDAASLDKISQAVSEGLKNSGATITVLSGGDRLWIFEHPHQDLSLSVTVWCDRASLMLVSISHKDSLPDVVRIAPDEGLIILAQRALKNIS